MKRLAIIAASLLLLSGCGVIFWTQERVQCGLKCPKNAECAVFNSGVFTASYACRCKWPGKDGPWWASDGQPCQPQPSPSPK